MNFVNHTNKEWLAKRIAINGAETYSKDLTTYQIPYWEQLLRENDIISTCPLFYNTTIKGNYRVAVQYLHSYPYNNPVLYAKKVEKAVQADHVIYITAYKEYEKMLRFMNLKAVHIPMSIDSTAICQYSMPKAGHDRILYFGQLRNNKKLLAVKIKQACKDLDIVYDSLSYNLFNGEVKYTREEGLRLVSTYQYGIGVGRCAQEMMALGVKVLIGGIRFGGIITTEEEYEQQLSTNMNGRLHTFSPNIKTCLLNIDKSIYRANDIKSMNHAEIVYNAYPEIFNG